MENPEYIWKCLDCPFTAEGTSDGSGHLLTHLREVGRLGEKHDYTLANAETGEPVKNDKNKNIKSLKQAQALGLVPIKSIKGSPKKVKKNGGDGSIIKGKTRPIDVDIDSRLLLLYNWDVATMDWHGTFSQWLSDCVMGFHIDHGDELQLDRLFEGVK